MPRPPAAAKNRPPVVHSASYMEDLLEPKLIISASRLTSRGRCPEPSPRDSGSARCFIARPRTYDLFAELRVHNSRLLLSTQFRNREGSFPLGLGFRS
jgi:hypothetical protein